MAKEAPEGRAARGDRASPEPDLIHPRGKPVGVCGAGAWGLNSPAVSALLRQGYEGQARPPYLPDLNPEL